MMKCALYGIMAAAVVMMTGCASNCCGPINGPLLGRIDGCGGGIDTMFGGCTSGGCGQVATVGCTSSCTASCGGGCTAGGGGAYSGGCSQDVAWEPAPIVDSPRNSILVEDCGSGLGGGCGGGLLGSGALAGGACGSCGAGGGLLGGLVGGGGACGACGAGGAVAGLAVQPAKAAIGSVRHVARTAVNMPQQLQQGCANGYGQSMGPTEGSVQYPYYTTRGPRDFFMAKPPSIGP